MNPQDPHRLESSIHRILRSVPDRTAPAGLEGRVLAEIALRAALPWWRRSFTHWPAAVRAAFVAGSAVAAALLMAGVIALVRNPGAVGLAGVAEPFAWLRAARDLFTSADSSVRRVIAAIPRLWLYGAVGLIAAGYALLGAISATLYRAVTFGRQAH